MKIDARRLVRDFGGHTELMRKLAAAGSPVSSSEKYGRDTVEKWCGRQSIPGRWLVQMNSIQPFNISDYTINPQPKKRSKKK